MNSNLLFLLLSLRSRVVVRKNCHFGCCCSCRCSCSRCWLFHLCFFSRRNIFRLTLRNGLTKTQNRTLLLFWVVCPERSLTLVLRSPRLPGIECPPHSCCVLVEPSVNHRSIVFLFDMQRIHRINACRICRRFTVWNLLRISRYRAFSFTLESITRIKPQSNPKNRPRIHYTNVTNP